VGEYLYGISQDYAQKKVSLVEAEIRKEEEDRTSTHAIKRSTALQARLKHKRFKQVFEFLDEAQVGLVDLVGTVSNNPVMMDVLDDEVRADVEAAARLYARQQGRAAAAADGTYPPVDAEKFYALMEEALGARRGPRSYIAPSPPAKFRPADTHQPKINRASEAMVSRVRPKEVPVYELLYREAEHQAGKLQEARRAHADDDLRECTFRPTLVAEPLVRESLVRKYIQTGAVPSPSSRKAGGGPFSHAFDGAGAPSGAKSDGAGAPSGAGAGAAGVLLDDQKYEELEREVQEMLAATSMATAAIERLPSKSDQVYLTRILGLSGQASSGGDPVTSSFSARS